MLMLRVRGFVKAFYEGSLDPSLRKEAVPAANLISAECKFTQVRILALLLAEFVGPPPMRQQAEPSSAMIADLRLPHTLAQHFISNKSFDENPSNAK
jgi:hypothetical protein